MPTKTGDATDRDPNIRTVFIRDATEMQDGDVRSAIIHLLHFRLQNEANHIQFMAGYGSAHHGHPSFVEGNRSLLLEWERQGHRVRKLAVELEELNADARAAFSEATYTLEGGSLVHPLFATHYTDWEDMLVWRWIRARAWCYRSMVEFGGLYVPLSQAAFQQYFDLGLSRWPAGSTTQVVERLRDLYQDDGYDRVVASVQRWYPLAWDFLSVDEDRQEDFIELRVWVRTLDLVRKLFRTRIEEDLRLLGIPPRVIDL